MWTSAAIERPTRVQRATVQKKLMLWKSFSCTGAFDVIALPPAERFTRKFFVGKVMDSFIGTWAKKMPTVEATGTLLHLDSAGPHLALETFEHHGITRLHRPPDSRNLSPADFWLFGYIKATLEGFFFLDINEARDRIVAILRSIPLRTFIRVFDEWKERMAE
jgi:hypothetical protein